MIIIYYSNIGEYWPTQNVILRESEIASAIKIMWETIFIKTLRVSRWRHVIQSNNVQVQYLERCPLTFSYNLREIVYYHTIYTYLLATWTIANLSRCKVHFRQDTQLVPDAKREGVVGGFAVEEKRDKCLSLPNSPSVKSCWASCPVPVWFP